MNIFSLFKKKGESGLAYSELSPVDFGAKTLQNICHPSNYNNLYRKNGRFLLIMPRTCHRLVTYAFDFL